MAVRGSHVAALLLLVAARGLADITGTNPPAGTCLCFTADYVNLRSTGCGSVVGQAFRDDCHRARGQKTTCQLSSTWYEFFQIESSSGDVWTAGNYLRQASGIECGDGGGQPTSEFRGMWIATAWNVDWPSSASLSTAAQQAEADNYLNIMQQLNMNALILQLRPAGDAFYQSDIEPWSRYLTGTQGVAPSPYYDPLQYFIDGAHQRGIEIHAWLNPYRANLSPNWSGLTPNHMANQFPQYAHPYGTTLWMDPGATEVQDRLVQVVRDIVNRYAVDAIHFDDYFYPYPVSGVDFPDDATYQRYLDGGGTMSRADWRRDNVNRMVERIYNQIKADRRSCKFGISPFGIYRPGHPEGMPPPIAGLDQYSALYADPKLWLQNGWVDYMAPQLYWAIDPPAQSYPVLLDWWLNNNPVGRHIYAGNAVYKMESPNDWPVTEITNQVEISRTEQSRLSLGNIMYSAKFFRDNLKGIRDVFAVLYSNQVTIPPMPWLQEEE